MINRPNANDVKQLKQQLLELQAGLEKSGAKIAKSLAEVQAIHEKFDALCGNKTAPVHAAKQDQKGPKVEGPKGPGKRGSGG